METQSDSLVTAGRFDHERRIEIGVLAFIVGLLVLGLQTAAGLPVSLGGLSTTMPVRAKLAPVSFLSEAVIGSAVLQPKGLCRFAEGGCRAATEEECDAVDG